MQSGQQRFDGCTGDGDTQLMVEMPGGMPAEQNVEYRTLEGPLHLMLRARTGLPSP